jgi:CheY-like chemotaxis protein
MLREKNFSMSHIPIIGLSGNAREEHVQAALKVGMDEYIVKPYRKADLLAKIARFTVNVK